MDRVFSVDDITDQFWSPPPIPIRLGEDDESGSGSGSGSSSTNNKNNNSSSSTSSKMMNRSSSEWAFQRFLQEASASNHSPPPPARPHNDVVEIKDNNNNNNNNNNSNATPSSGSHNNNNNNNNNNNINQGNVEVKGASTTSFPVPPPPPPNVPVDSDEYQAFLKSRLDLACAAVALTRANYVKPRETPENASQGSSTAQLGSQVASKGIGLDPVNGEDKDIGGPLGIPSLPAVQKKSGIHVRSTTSGSSREESDEDEGEEDIEATENMDPSDAKRMRRMLSNRESARRSRRRKQAHLTELETQVSQLRVENSSLLKRLTDVSTQYNEAAVDNRVLKADVETLRAKVKMAEETVKRVTGLSPLFQAMSEISTMGMPSFAASPSDTSADAAVPVQDDPKQHFYQPPSGNHLPAHDPRIQNGMLEIPSVDNNVCQNPATVAAPGNKMGRTSSMQRVASLEHLQKRIRGEVSSRGNQGNGDQ